VAVLLGSPAYMSPEQVDADWDAIGPATDQYSLGVMLYEMITGQLPFNGSIASVMAQILTKEPVAPRKQRPDLDRRIETLCLKMMAKKPSHRYSSLAEVADTIVGILKNPKAKDATQASVPVVPREPRAASTPSAADTAPNCQEFDGQ
jgi:serine/threonine protein kinase